VQLSVRSKKPTTLRRCGKGLLVFSVIVLWSCSGPVRHVDESGKAEVAESAACLEAAKAKLGEGAAVLRCVRLRDGAIEALSVIKLGNVRECKGCVPVSRLVVIRQEGAVWQIALEVGATISNAAGYVATEYIDDANQFFGYCLRLEDKRSDGVSAFTISLTDINPAGHEEGASTEISWNATVRRYQEFVTLEGFRPEIKNPPHINTRGECCGKAAPQHDLTPSKRFSARQARS
jgi:hypothetical protein